MIMTRPRVILVGLALVVVAAAGLYRFYGSAGSTETRASRGGNAATRGAAAVPVTTALARIEDFAIRRQTIGIIELPAIVVVRSRVASQVTDSM